MSDVDDDDSDCWSTISRVSCEPALAYVKFDGHGMHCQDVWFILCILFSLLPRLKHSHFLNLSLQDLELPTLESILNNDATANAEWKQEVNIKLYFPCHEGTKIRQLCEACSRTCALTLVVLFFFSLRAVQ